MAINLALPLTFMKFSRNFESEADFLGVQYMYKTGYDPQAFITFFEKIEAKDKKKPGTLARAFASHPPTPDRITKTQEEITQHPADPAAVRPQHVGVRLREGAAGLDPEPQEGDSDHRPQQADVAPSHRRQRRPTDTAADRMIVQLCQSATTTSEPAW